MNESKRAKLIEDFETLSTQTHAIAQEIAGNIKHVDDGPDYGDLADMGYIKTQLEEVLRFMESVRNA